MMFIGRNNSKLKSNSALAIAAGCAVAFMFITTIASVFLFWKHMQENNELLEGTEYSNYDSYVVFISSDDTDDFWSSVYESASSYGKEHGIYVDMLSRSLSIDYTKQQLLEMAIDSGCDGILLEGDDTPETYRLLQKAASKGISVVTMLTDVDYEQRICFVSINTYSIANQYANKILKEAEASEQDIIPVTVLEKSDFVEDGNTSMVTSIQEAVSGGLANGDKQVSFDVKIISSDDDFETEKFVKDLFINQDLSGIVVCLDEHITASVYQAVIDYNRVGLIDLYGYYQSESIFTGIEHGVIDSTITVDTDSMGESAVSAFEEFRDSKFVSDYFCVDATLIDQHNVRRYRKEVADE